MMEAKGRYDASSNNTAGPLDDHDRLFASSSTTSSSGSSPPPLPSSSLSQEQEQETPKNANTMTHSRKEHNVINEESSQQSSSVNEEQDVDDRTDDGADDGDGDDAESENESPTDDEEEETDTDPQPSQSLEENSSETLLPSLPSANQSGLDDCVESRSTLHEKVEPQVKNLLMVPSKDTKTDEGEKVTNDISKAKEDNNLIDISFQAHFSSTAALAPVEAPAETTAPPPQSIFKSMELERARDGIALIEEHECSQHPSLLNFYKEYEGDDDDDDDYHNLSNHNDDDYYDDQYDEEEGLLGTAGSPGGYIVASQKKQKHLKRQADFQRKKRDLQNRVASYADPVKLQRALQEATLAATSSSASTFGGPGAGSATYYQRRRKLQKFCRSPRNRLLIVAISCILFLATIVHHRHNNNNNHKEKQGSKEATIIASSPDMMDILKTNVNVTEAGNTAAAMLNDFSHIDSHIDTDPSDEDGDGDTSTNDYPIQSRPHTEHHVDGKVGDEALDLPLVQKQPSAPGEDETAEEEIAIDSPSEPEDIEDVVVDNTVVYDEMVTDDAKNNNNNQSIQRISVLGEHHSGLEEILETLRVCFPKVDVRSGMVEGREGYWFQDVDIGDNDENKQHSLPLPKTLVVATFRNPYAWVEEMRRYPPSTATSHNIFSGDDNDDWKTFVTTSWTILAGPNAMERPPEDAALKAQHPNGSQHVCQRGFTYEQVIPCFAPKEEQQQPYPLYELTRNGSGNPYESITHLRRQKIENFLSVQFWPNVEELIPVQYESLFVSSTPQKDKSSSSSIRIQRIMDTIVPRIERWTGLTRDCNDDVTDIELGGLPSSQRPVLPFSPGDYHMTYLEWMNKHVDWDVEAMIGYQPITLTTLSSSSSSSSSIIMNNDDNDKNENTKTIEDNEKENPNVALENENAVVESAKKVASGANDVNSGEKEKEIVKESQQESTLPPPATTKMVGDNSMTDTSTATSTTAQDSNLVVIDCGCPHSCTSSVLDQIVLEQHNDDTQETIQITCRDQILKAMKQLPDEHFSNVVKEREACSIVASSGSPNPCIPACDPEQCGNHKWDATHNTDAATTDEILDQEEQQIIETIEEFVDEEEESLEQQEGVEVDDSSAPQMPTAAENAVENAGKEDSSLKNQDPTSIKDDELSPKGPQEQQEEVADGAENNEEEEDLTQATHVKLPSSLPTKKSPPTEFVEDQEESKSFEQPIPEVKETSETKDIYQEEEVGTKENLSSEGEVHEDSESSGAIDIGTEEVQQQKPEESFADSSSQEGTTTNNVDEQLPLTFEENEVASSPPEQAVQQSVDPLVQVEEQKEYYLPQSSFSSQEENVKELDLQPSENLDASNSNAASGSSSTMLRHCGFKDADGGTVECNDFLSPCETDFDCMNDMLFNECLEECNSS